MDNATPDLDAIRASLSNANFALDESVARWYRTDTPLLLAALDEARAELAGLRRAYDTACEQVEAEMDGRIAAEARATALEATLATVRAEHTRDRERLAKVEALAKLQAVMSRAQALPDRAWLDVLAIIEPAALATTSEEAER